MLEQTTKKISFYEKVSLMIMTKMPIDPQQERIKYLKCKLGIESILVDFSKILIIYGLALYFNMFLEVLVFQVGYILIRSFAQGAHARVNSLCIIISVVVFMGVPFIIKNGYTFTSNYLFGMVLVNYFFIYLYAPSDTKKNPVNNPKRRIQMRNKALVCNSIILVICLINNNNLLENYFVLGSVFATLFLLPIMHKILD